MAELLSGLLFCLLGIPNLYIMLSPGAVLVKGAVKPLARQALSPSSNKENVPPVGAVRDAPKRSLTI